MTESGDKSRAGALAYQSPVVERPIPVWKHFVFVPLLFWVGLFVVAAVAALIVGMVALLSA